MQEGMGTVGGNDMASAPVSTNCLMGLIQINGHHGGMEEYGKGPKHSGVGATPLLLAGLRGIPPQV